MDTSLGKRGKYIDFDYDAFHEAHQALGGSQDASGLTVNLHPINATGRGYYNIASKSIHLNTNIGVGGRRMKNTLQHELKHAVDFDKKPRSKIRATANDIGGKVISNPIAMGLMPPLSAIPLFNTAAVLYEHEEYYRLLDKAAVIPALGFVALAGTASLYVLDKYERRGRKAGRRKLKPIITSSPME